MTGHDLNLRSGFEPRAGRSVLLADAQLADAVRLGWITPPAFVANGVPAHTPLAQLDELLRDLANDRADR